MPDFPKVYDPHAHEERIYRLWEESGYFNPDTLPPRHKKPFTIIMPPPNANGPLHAGHALMLTLEDIMIRFERMRGRRALWLPGADHAGFETQVVFDKKLEREGRNRFQIPREGLFKEIWEFTKKNKEIMEGQIRKIGASCDWSRERFTLDPAIVSVVYETFEKLYEDGLAYRGLRVVNWCPKHETALSDLEVKYTERMDPLYYIAYGPLTLATVRPETKFGDTALAVNPKDKRYQKYIGKEIEAKGLLGPLTFKVIADEAVDPNFGTGVVKVTPAHDPADFEIWSRHQGEISGPKQIIDERGRLTRETGLYAGMKVAEAREKVAKDMEKLGILEKVDPSYTHQVATCYKCGNTLEPLPKMQWFIAMTEKPLRNQKSKSKNQKLGKSLRDLAVEAVRQGKIKFVTKKFENVFFHWMANLRDWNISRQIVWGIRIPAWYCKDMLTAICKKEKGIIVAREAPAACLHCGGRNIEQDPDVFDTWFSSGQWPFAALPASRGSNAKIKNQQSTLRSDFDTFYPTDVMATAYEILFFWVARMIMLGFYRTGKVPFAKIYLHGLVRDKDRQKMSKSKGNVVDPLGIAEGYGMDALRMGLVAGTAAGTDIALSEDKIRGYRNFATKVWNIGRFLAMNGVFKEGRTAKLAARHQKRFKEFEALKKRVTKLMEEFKFHLAAEETYHYLWHTFADEIVEEAKTSLKEGSESERASAAKVLREIFMGSLKLLHPFMPFLSEALFQELHHGEKGKLLMVESW